MVLHIHSDGSSEDALAQVAAQHRATFYAGINLRRAREWQDTLPHPMEAGSACSEFLEDDIHAATPKDRARQFRRLGLVGLVTLCAMLSFADAVVNPRPIAKPVSGVWA